MYNGPYRNPNQLASRVQLVDNHLETLKVGSMVAVVLKDWAKNPVIGKVLAINAEKFHVHYWKGTYNTRWEPHMIYDRSKRIHQPWDQWLPKSSIILANFELLLNHLQAQTKTYLRQQCKKYFKKP